MAGEIKSLRWQTRTSDTGYFHSASEDEDFHCISFVPNLLPELLQKAQLFQEALLEKDSSSKKINNYYQKRLKLPAMDLISLILNSEGKTVAFSSLYLRDFFGSDKARCLNRYYVDPDLRSWRDFRVMRFPTVMVHHQLQRAKQLDLSFIFLSIEPPKKHWCENIRKVLEEELNLPWVFPPNLYLVCPDEDAKSCWQHVIYTAINGSSSSNFKISKTMEYKE